MRQVLVDLYEVEFNDVRKLSPSGENIVVHATNPEEYIVLGKGKSVIVGKPYLTPLEKYGGGFKSTKLVEVGKAWLGSTVSAKVANQKNVPVTHSYRMVEV